MLCPCKQRAGLQREQPCFGRTGETAAASPGIRSKTHHSDSALREKHNEEKLGIRYTTKDGAARLFSDIPYTDNSLSFSVTSNQLVITKT